MMDRNIWFTSDTHFGHANIIRYCQRPFVSTDEMDWAIIERWNAVVKPHHKVYHLGDVVINKKFLPLVKALNGHKRLVRGNHDILPTKAYLDAGFEEILSMRVLNGMLFTHIPIHPASRGRFGLNVHGHLHDKVVTKDGIEGFPEPDENYLNVSVEHTNYTPVPMDWIMEQAVQRIGSRAIQAAKINAWSGSH
jgi:calcineurin-like phosphoesterase family protein